jgi:hypothetical protein
MKFKMFYHDKSIGYLQVEEGIYEETELPEIIGIQIINEKTLECRNKISQIEKYCDENAIWHISDLVYFDSIEERMQFILIWS